MDNTELIAELKKGGFVVSDAAIQGAFHCASQGEQASPFLNFIESDASFQFLSSPAFQHRSPAGTGFVTEKFQVVVAKSMLIDKADWQTLYTSLQNKTSSSKSSQVISFGRQRCVPQWYARTLGRRLLHLANIDLSASQMPAELFPLKYSAEEDESIAVVGMACHLPGGRDLDEFWQTLRTGESQHSEVPQDRFAFDTSPWRESSAKRKWFGNFVDDYDTFDHKFFKKSPREMSSTDPQQRIMMQVAYQAVQQSGHFNKLNATQHIGCYVGIGVVDYERNVSCHQPTAYTATGNLRSFAAGKISHHFGWTGPGVTIDTACSSSALAVHNACKAILGGECDAAVAGGVHVMTSYEWHQNLDGASFLSHTGQCKPFDKDADGYCRGEGAGAVFLKKRSAAIADGDQIFGIINATAVNQNENCSAITAPSSFSLSNVFTDAIQRARLSPEQISVVEAHGTGTQVGDPAEYESIRKVLGGSIRSKPLIMGSAKGHIGHLEFASGIASLIKLLLMMNHASIPPQASHSTLNPKLNASSADNIEIVTKETKWDSEFKAALLNNYGASGSNVSLVVSHATEPIHQKAQDQTNVARPFWLSSIDEKSMETNAAKLSQHIRSKLASDKRITLSNLSFQVSRQSDRSLGQGLVFSSSSLDDLLTKLDNFSSGNGDLTSVPIKQSTQQPVVLCFGGQTSNFVGLDRDVYDQFAILRKHINHCNEVCISLGLGSIIPAIFERTPRTSIVELQTMQFALQYACAQSWIDSGVQVKALIGHSFGELTAMCVSGRLSVEDALKMISRRSKLIEDKWGPESGSMMAVDAGQETIEKLIIDANNANPQDIPINIACFNGPRSFTLAGSPSAINALQQTISSDSKFSSIKTKVLSVTNAFHSALVEPLVADLEHIGDDLVFRAPKIHHERATIDGSEPAPGKLFASHMRDPVYFNQAVQRLAKQYPQSIWIEAGSTSGVTTMAGRAVGSSDGITFQGLNLTSGVGVKNITDSTVNLWKKGLAFNYWAHSPEESSGQAPLLLPPYQFEKSRHWLENLKIEPKIQTEIVSKIVSNDLWTFTGYKDKKETQAQFRINTNAPEYIKHLTGHVIAQTAPICPSVFQLSMAREALLSIIGEQGLLPEVADLESDSVLCLDPSKSVWLEADKLDEHTWNFRIISTDGPNPSTSKGTQHVSGRYFFRRPQDCVQEFAKYERLVDSRRMEALLDGQEAEEVVQGSRNIYKAFSPCVQYFEEEYRGLQKVASRGLESAGRIVKPVEKDTFLSVALSDAFCQETGFYVNCMTDIEDGEIYISNKIEQWIRSPNVPMDFTTDRWNLYARHHQSSPKEYVSDVFVFDGVEGRLVWVIIGLHFVKVSAAGMSRLLERLSPNAKSAAKKTTSVKPEVQIESISADIEKPKTIEVPQVVKREARKQPAKKAGPPSHIIDGVKRVFVNLLGIEPEDIKLESDLVELGIDSLLAMEVAREVETEFKTTLELDQLMEMTDVRSMVNIIATNLGEVIEMDSGCDETSSSDDDDIDTISTAASDITEFGKEGKAAFQETLPGKLLVDTFTEAKLLTDYFIEQNQMSGYSNIVQPKVTEMVVIHILDAFEQLGCPLRTMQAGENIERVPYLSKHEQVMAVFYRLLKEARIIDVKGSSMTRTAVSTPQKAAATLLQELLRDHPEHQYDYQLTALTGNRLADCLSGKAEGIQMLFGSAEGREISAGMYSKSPFNVAWQKQLQHFLKKLFEQLPQDQSEPVNILEIGSGTGGTTSGILPILAATGIPFCYTVSDISPSLVADLRRRFSKQYPQMKFEILNIEKDPAPKLLNTQHIVLATNCLHATHSLTTTTGNIHKMLRPDGCLAILEMTEELPWVDSIFGLVEGWWLFNDGRTHCSAQPEFWEKILRANGYGHVDWSDGHLPETSVQRIIFATASGQAHQRVAIPPKPVSKPATDSAARQELVNSYVDKYTKDFTNPINASPRSIDTPRCVLVTGATGSLGSHLVAYFAEQPNVHKVICLNRLSSRADGFARQSEALTSRSLLSDSELISKLEVVESDTSKPLLGRSVEDYEKLVCSVTDIVHNAWPMSLTRATKGFELQFKTMKNLIDLSSACASRDNAPVIGFQLISSVAVVGNHPFITGEPLVPEIRMTTGSGLPIGYADSKLICERMLDETLHKHPDYFRPMVARLGQIAGSKITGWWNPVEHLAQLVKSSQTLNMLPDLDGGLSWFSVNDIAATAGELLLGDAETSYPIFHIENPVRQPWKEMTRMLADALAIPHENIVPYSEWLHNVRHFPPSLAVENPASKLAEFFETEFLRMACGGMILDTKKTQECSQTLRNARAVDNDLARLYVQGWKDMEFLRS